MSSLTLQKRKNTHKQAMKHSKRQSAFYNALRKYGMENTEWGIMEENLTRLQAIEKEMYYIKKMKTICPKGYNITEGGRQPIITKETKRKISMANKGNIQTDAMKLAISHHNLIYYSNPENKKAHSERMKIINNQPEKKRKLAKRQSVRLKKMWKNNPQEMKKWREQYAKVRRAKNTKKIIEIIEQMQKEDVKITNSEIQRRSGYSWRTVKERLLFLETKIK